MQQAARNRWHQMTFNWDGWPIWWLSNCKYSSATHDVSNSKNIPWGIILYYIDWPKKWSHINTSYIYILYIIVYIVSDHVNKLPSLLTKSSLATIRPLVPVLRHRQNLDGYSRTHRCSAQLQEDFSHRRSRPLGQTSDGGFIRLKDVRWYLQNSGNFRHAQNGDLAIATQKTNVLNGDFTVQNGGLATQNGDWNSKICLIISGYKHISTIYIDQWENTFLYISGLMYTDTTFWFQHVC